MVNCKMHKPTCGLPHPLAESWASPCRPLPSHTPTCDRPRLTRVMVSRITGPPAPCALSLPTSSWSNTATARTALSLARASGAEVESMSAWRVCVGGGGRRRDAGDRSQRAPGHACGRWMGTVLGSSRVGAIGWFKWAEYTCSALSRVGNRPPFPLRER